jgi:hypothetical protein
VKPAEPSASFSVQALLNLASRAGRFEFPTEQSDATTQAAANFELNRAALERVWPRAVIALPEHFPDVEWLFARDGSLSARHIDGEWVGGQSVPRLAAQRLYGKFVLSGSTGALLAPTHAQQMVRVLDRTSARQAVIAIIPGETTAGILMSCADFSQAILDRRLWIAVGPDWRVELKAILDTNDGIAPISMMIRVPGLNQHELDLVQKSCDQTLATHNQAHRHLVSMIHAKPRSPNRPATSALVVGGAFELWNDGPSMLGELAARSTLRCEVLDSSRPDQSSALRLARRAEANDAIVMANVGRADLANIVPDNVPWVTFATHRVPGFVASAPMDVVVVVDEASRERATLAGWPAAQVRFAVEPVDVLPLETGAGAAVIADCPVIVMPQSIHDMSSHRLAWEWVEQTLSADPLALGGAFGGAIDPLLQAAATKAGVPAESMPVDVLRDQLIAPLFVREMTRQLVRRAGLRVFGQGWDQLPDVASAWRWSVGSKDELKAALKQSAVLVDLWPTQSTHRVRRVGRPTLRAWGRSWSALLGDLRSASLATRPTKAVAEALSIDRLGL